eukprot:TRINITY_DN19606_c0_g1::TRINITY_DN19606_c0_g1_i1::g.24606::m.24606 TRINITY_DN19606_c0_g1::TRINITY_DN19606_c0_g1_i1::g.24606  ORF type:complete len:293 (+),score=36.26,sp/Q9D8U7/DTWD1_MOUSE/31.62/6e-33,DTW/PF03942.10/7.1e-25 TRINITY_DN19606_c0_g1_i1:39-881(+)
MEKTEFLDSLQIPEENIKRISQLPRQQCQSCTRNRRFFCYDCLCPLGDEESIKCLPNLDLPVEVDIIKHPHELLSKSSAVHAAVLCPKQVRIRNFPEGLDEYDPKTTAVIFPSADSKSVADFDLSSLKKILLVDSTWQTARQVMGDSRITSLPAIKLAPQHATCFWRYQPRGKRKLKGSGFLSSIEALHQFFVEYAMAKDGNYNGHHDGLLFYFKLNHSLIVEEYKNHPERNMIVEGFMPDSDQRDSKKQRVDTEAPDTTGVPGVLGVQSTEPHATDPHN